MTGQSNVALPVGAATATVSRQRPLPLRGAPTPWLWMSVAAALIAAAGNVVGLAGIGGVYGKETSAFVNQAIAQDTVNLAVVCPAIIILALLARRGRLGAYLAWLGTLAFTVYNYVIYTLSVHAGALYLPWIAVLGLAIYALIGGLAILDVGVVKARLARAPRGMAGWFLIVVTAVFTALWLSSIIPAVLAGDVPAGARELGLPSNPVHVLDLAFYLPAAFASGVLLLRGRAWAYASAPALLVFLALTGLPILLTPFVANARGDAPGWAVLPPVAVITVASLVLTGRLLSAARPAAAAGGAGSEAGAGRRETGRWPA
jgi:hypothetical protein